VPYSQLAGNKNKNSFLTFWKTPKYVRNCTYGVRFRTYFEKIKVKSAIGWNLDHYQWIGISKKITMCANSHIVEKRGMKRGGDFRYKDRKSVSKLSLKAT